jgi:aspartyl-tRNA(Asn)/glutamyl-tRNA(Gln) amidotransferase subunit A
LSTREITEAFIAEIEKKDEGINAFITTTFDLAREMADSADARRVQGDLLSDIDGMPITLKDCVCTKGILTTAASRSLENFIPPYDATVWKKLKEAGAVLLGKTNTDEYTMGASTETSAFGATRNPHDLERVAGGSSGGAAAAVAANFCAAAIGTDTGGSIRQPAHFCGVTGIKVSYGRVSRWGTIPMASSLDTVGALAKTPADCALVLNIIAGQDEKDSTTPDQPVPDYTQNLEKPLTGLKVGIPTEYFLDGIDPEITAAIDVQKKHLEALGAETKEVSLPHTTYAIPTYYIIAPSEISANMSRYDGLRFGASKGDKNLEDIYTESREYGFGDEVKRRILIGTYSLSAGYYDAFYRKAQKVRTLIKQDFDKAFEEVDVLLAPTSPNTAFKVGEQADDPLKMYIEDALVAPANLAGVTGLSIPAAMSSKGLPIGAQIIGPAYSEDRILNVAHQLYQKNKSA